MAKTKRYNGEEDGSFVESGSGPQMGEDTGMSEKEPESPKPSTFKEAFASARKAGDKTFMFGGKKFTTEMAGSKKPESKPESKPEPKKELKYQSMQDRKREYEAAREKSGVSMYGATKREKVPAEDRVLKDARIRKSEQVGMGSLKFSKGGSASKRADGIAMRGKTRGKMV